MKFALAVYGTRGDVEPFAAVGLELLRRGHEVRMAAPPNLVGFAESTGHAAVAYGPDSRKQLDENFIHNLYKFQNPIRLLREGKELITRGWLEMSKTLTSLADGADLILTGAAHEELAANVAEYYGTAMAALYPTPLRVNGQILPTLPPTLTRFGTSVLWWMYRRLTKEAWEAQRRELGLPKRTCSRRRVIERESLEIQTYDEVCFPELAAEWSRRRPFVGALTMELPTDADNEVASWIAAGTAPIYFGFGSQPVRSPTNTVVMIAAACAELGERALICTGANDFTDVPHFDHVKLVGAVNHAAIFPLCRAVVHHGGAGTTAAGLRAGIPTLILWITEDQPIWAAQIKWLKVGLARRFSKTTQESLVVDLRAILTPPYITRAREIATQMTKPATSVTAVTDLLEETAGLTSFG
jgi:UDP:flavonoid glycosyltransferase YjiC (YdhE family)